MILRALWDWTTIMKLQILFNRVDQKEAMVSNCHQMKTVVFAAGSILAFLVHFPIRRWIFLRRIDPMWSKLSTKGDTEDSTREDQCIDRFESAVYDGHVQAVKTALNVHPDWAVRHIHRDGSRGTPFQIASTRGHADIVSLLAGYDDVNVHHRFKGNRTILILAAESYHNEEQLKRQDRGIRRFFPLKKDSVIECLIRLGIDINHQDANGNSALMTACLFHHLHIASKLMDAGADPMMENHQGLTAVDIALENEEMCAFFGSKLRMRPDTLVDVSSIIGVGQIPGSPPCPMADSDHCSEQTSLDDDWNSCLSSIDDIESVVSSSGSTNATYLHRHVDY